MSFERIFDLELKIEEILIARKDESKRTYAAKWFRLYYVGFRFGFLYFRGFVLFSLRVQVHYAFGFAYHRFTAHRAKEVEAVESHYLRKHVIVRGFRDEILLIMLRGHYLREVRNAGGFSHRRALIIGVIVSTCQESFFNSDTLS